MKLLRRALPIACAAASTLSCGDAGQRTPLLVDAASAERTAPGELGVGRAAPDALDVGRAAPARGGAPGEHRFCGWLHEFLGDPGSTELGYDTFAAHAGAFDAVHPKWWRVASPTTFENHPRGRATPFAGFHDR